MSAMKHFLLSCFCVFFFSSAAQAAEFLVAPGGNDAKSGSLEEPFATPARALEKARRVKDEPVTVHLRGGVYQLDKPLKFTPEDTRTDKAPLTIRAHHDERPILSAGVKLTGWKVGDDGRWRMTLDAVKNGQWNFGQLFVGDQRRPRPRVPATGYFSIASSMPPNAANANRGFDRFQFRDAELDPGWSNRVLGMVLRDQGCFDEADQAFRAALTYENGFEPPAAPRLTELSDHRTILALHQGRGIRSRSASSILAEVERLTPAPGWRPGSTPTSP